LPDILESSLASLDLPKLLTELNYSMFLVSHVSFSYDFRTVELNLEVISLMLPESKDEFPIILLLKLSEKKS